MRTSYLSKQFISLLHTHTLLLNTTISYEHGNLPVQLSYIIIKIEHISHIWKTTDTFNCV